MSEREITLTEGKVKSNVKIYPPGYVMPPCPPPPPGRPNTRHNPEVLAKFSKLIITHTRELAENMLMKRTLQKGYLSPEDMVVLKGYHNTMQKFSDEINTELSPREAERTLAIVDKVAQITYNKGKK